MAKMQDSLPNWQFESQFLDKGYELIGGTDEVGRGCFAGPVVAGCVIFPKHLICSELSGVIINDSKKLSSQQRLLADKWIRENALSYGIGVTGVPFINKYGIKKAAESAFRKAVKALDVKIDFLLTDAFYIPGIKGIGIHKQLPIIKGDAKSLSIAAASIVAKVYRDSLMERLSHGIEFGPYLWHKNKGYGTMEHRNAIKVHGITKFHRVQFVNTWLQKSLV